MNEKIVKHKLELLYPGKEIEVKSRLLGGMSNYTFIVEIDKSLYSYRIPGEYSEHFVNREIEINNLRLMETLNITNKTVYFSVETGEKLAKFIPGTSLNLYNEVFPYDEVAKLLKVIHNSPVLADNDYKPLFRLNSYESLLKKLAYIHPQEYYKVKEEFLSYSSFLNSIKTTLAHGDAQPSNFIIHETGLITVDFEYSGNIDPIYDIACFANIKLSDGEELMRHYFSSPTKDEWKRFYLWRAFQSLQWHNVALFKEMKGLSKDLHIDFKKVANNYFEAAKMLLEKVSKL